MGMIIGREHEMSILDQCMKSNTAELLAIYGRRRVGKTYLVRNYFQSHLCFELTGIYDASLDVQLANFSQALRQAILAKRKKSLEPKNWLEAFIQLQQFIETRKGKKKKVLFFDELPWLDTRRSGFMQAFEHFWNHWASRRKDLIVVICGSAASWMIHKIIKSRGGLHNRITRSVRLLPFTLQETEAYLQSRRVRLDRYQLLHIYMVMGGIPHYLKEVKPGESAIQAIDRICFVKDGLLASEFGNLYAALFDNARKHVQVIKALAAKRMGLTRTELTQYKDLKSGGTLSSILEELVESGFITSCAPFEKKSKDTLYRLTDEYSLFFLKFIEPRRIQGKNGWMQHVLTPSWKSWSGYTFEGICMKHSEQIKKALGITGIHTEMASWFYKGKEEGAQIDMLINRADRCINLCEIKFAEGVYEINKSYAVDVEKKMRLFKDVTKVKKTVFITMITTYGVKENIYKNSLVAREISLDALFEKVE